MTTCTGRGQDNPDVTRFCLACGAALDVPAPAPTVLPRPAAWLATLPMLRTGAAASSDGERTWVEALAGSRPSTVDREV